MILSVLLRYFCIPPVTSSNTFPNISASYFCNSFDVLIAVGVFGTLVYDCIRQFLAKSALLFPAALSGPLCHYRYIYIYILV